MSDLLDELLAPLCRLLVAQGVAFPDLSERLKGHYVRAALDLAEGKTTDSRLSVMTGLQRRDIARLREFESKPARPNHLSRLVALWQSDPEYSQNGKARALPRTGDAPSFETLASAVRKDVHPRTMLDTLVAAGTVQISAGDIVSLQKTAYLPLGGSEDQLQYLAQNVGDHLAAASANVLGADPPFFERALHYSNLSEAQVADLRQLFQSGQMTLLETMNAKAATMKRTGDAAGEIRFRAGGYFFAETKEKP